MLRDGPLPPSSWPLPVRRAIAAVAARSAGPPTPPHARVTVHFHPDRLHRGELLIGALARDGVYRSQFETQTSNGSLSAFPGGYRHRWESRIFAGAYDDAPPSERPKYGALDHRLLPHGAAPRFGSCHLRLAAHTLARTTFCYPDSYLDPAHFGVEHHMPLLSLVEQADTDPLDAYVEAHLHGPLSLAHDVEALVLDPCYRDTDVERIARALPCPVAWHQGFAASAGVLSAHPDYRGPEPLAIALSLARGGLVTARDIGDAHRAGHHDPQLLKKAWHLVARFGAAS